MLDAFIGKVSKKLEDLVHLIMTGINVSKKEAEKLLEKLDDHCKICIADESVYRI